MSGVSGYLSLLIACKRLPNEKILSEIHSLPLKLVS